MGAYIRFHTNAFSVFLSHSTQCDVERMGMSIGWDNDGEPSGRSKREKPKNVQPLTWGWERNYENGWGVWVPLREIPFLDIVVLSTFGFLQT